MDPFCLPEGGKNLGGFPRLTALKVNKVTPESHVYMSCKTMVVKVHGKYPGSVLKTGKEDGDGFGTWLML